MSKLLLFILLTSPLILRAEETISDARPVASAHTNTEPGLTQGNTTVSDARALEIPKAFPTRGIQYLNPAARGGQDKWLRIGLIWASLALDLTSTRQALATNPNVREGNPLLRDSNGQFRTGLYLGAMLPINSLLTYGNLRYSQRKSIRIISYMASGTKIGFAISNFRHVR